VNVFTGGLAQERSIHVTAQLPGDADESVRSKCFLFFLKEKLRGFDK
jgi:hypothetical protein